MDVGDVLARLHISATLKLSDQPYFRNKTIVAVFNTGIVGMIENPTLDKVKNNGVQFDLTSSSKIYEVGVLIGKFEATTENEYVNRFNQCKEDARKALFDYFSAFAGKFKSKNIELSELHGFLVEEGTMPWTIDTYNEYQYQIPMHSEIPPSWQGDSINWKNQLCFKIKYELDSDTM